jgi:large subunit ribosomal protein L17
MHKDERDNLFKGLVQALFTHGSIQTSKSKAKAIKGLVDKVINLAKDKHAESRLQLLIADKNLRERLTKEIVPKMGSRTSGYTSLVRLGTRLGDQTMMVKMSLIGVEELKPIEKESRVKSQESRKETLKTETKNIVRTQKVKQPTKVLRKRGNKS